jgi:hypothetical protein
MTVMVVTVGELEGFVPPDGLLQFVSTVTDCHLEISEEGAVGPSLRLSLTTLLTAVSHIFHESAKG